MYIVSQHLKQGVTALLRLSNKAAISCSLFWLFGIFRGRGVGIPNLLGVTRKLAETRCFYNWVEKSGRKADGRRQSAGESSTAKS